MNLERCGWTALACMVLSTAHADGTPRHSAVMSVQGDENDNRQWLSSLTLPLGDHVWMQGRFGEAELATTPTSNVRTMGAAIGGGGRTLDAAIELVRRTGDSHFEQQDWAAALNWHGARGVLGADVFLRSASSESTTTSRPGGPLARPITTTIRESVDSTGFGLHGDFAPTERTRVFAGAMRYQHDFTVDSNAPIAPNTPLSSLFGTSTAALSGVWRDQAFIDRSYRIGGTYFLQRAAVTAQHFHDRIADGGEILNTTQVQAELVISDHWLLSPTIGYSSGSSQSAGYGGLSLGFSW